MSAQLEDFAGDPVLGPLAGEIASVLRECGARFAFVHGSRAQDRARARSDIDIAAYFGHQIGLIDVLGRLPGRVDLLVLDEAPLELAGRVAMHGRLLLDEDPSARVEWQATTRKIYLDELPRIERARRDFVAGMKQRG